MWKSMILNYREMKSSSLSIVLGCQLDMEKNMQYTSQDFIDDS